MRDRGVYLSQEQLGCVVPREIEGPQESTSGDEENRTIPAAALISRRSQVPGKQCSERQSRNQSSDVGRVVDGRNHRTKEEVISGERQQALQGCL